MNIFARLLAKFKKKVQPDKTGFWGDPSIDNPIQNYWSRIYKEMPTNDKPINGKKKE